MSLPVVPTFILFLLTICGALEATPSDIRVAGFKEGNAVLKTRLIGTVGWYKNGVPITNLLKNNSEFGRKMDLSPSGNLILQGLDLSDRGRYMCVGWGENHQNQSQIYDLAVYDASETVPVQTGQARGREQICVLPGQRLKIMLESFNQQILHSEYFLQARIKHNVRNMTEMLLECFKRPNSSLPSCKTLADGVNVSMAGTDLTIAGVTNSGQLDGFVANRTYGEFNFTVNIIVLDYAKLVSPKPTKTPMHSLGTKIVAGNYILILVLVLAVKLGIT